MKTNRASGQDFRAASSSVSVPLALTVKSVCGSFAAQSCEGWAAVCTTTSMSEPYSPKRDSIRSRSRMSIEKWA